MVIIRSHTHTVRLYIRPLDQLGITISLQVGTYEELIPQAAGDPRKNLSSQVAEWPSESRRLNLIITTNYTYIKKYQWNMLEGTKDQRRSLRVGWLFVIFVIAPITPGHWDTDYMVCTDFTKYNKHQSQPEKIMAVRICLWCDSPGDCRCSILWTFINHILVT